MLTDHKAYAELRLQDGGTRGEEGPRIGRLPLHSILS
jgi:hypothetical protein